MSSRKLSSDEVNALIEGLNSETSSQNSAADLSDADNVRPFTLGSDDLTVLGDYYALRMINERFARNSRSIFLPMLRLQPRISSFPPEVKTFDEYCSGLEGFRELRQACTNHSLLSWYMFVSVVTSYCKCRKIRNMYTLLQAMQNRTQT